MMNSKLSLSALVGMSLAAGLASTTAAANPFGYTDLAQGYNLAAASDEGKKAEEGKCGADKAKHEGKCGEGKCGADKAKHEGKCGEGKCGADKAKHEGKCGGEKKAEHEGKCGGEKKAEDKPQ